MFVLERAMDVAKSAVEAAARVALPHWERGVTVETKSDRTPVTIADKESEAVIMESLLGIKRAGADGILTYFARHAAQALKARG